MCEKTWFDCSETQGEIVSSKKPIFRDSVGLLRNN